MQINFQKYITKSGELFTPPRGGTFFQKGGNILPPRGGTFYPPYNKEKKQKKKERKKT